MYRITGHYPVVRGKSGQAARSLVKADRVAGSVRASASSGTVHGPAARALAIQDRALAGSVMLLAIPARASACVYGWVMDRAICSAWS